MKASQLLILGLIGLALAATVHGARNGRMLTVSVSARAGNGEDVEVSAFDNGKSSGTKSNRQHGDQQHRGDDEVSDDDNSSQEDDSSSQDDGWGNTQDGGSDSRGTNKKPNKKPGQQGSNKNNQQGSNQQGSNKDDQQDSNKINQQGSNQQGSNKDNRRDTPQASGMQGVLQQHNSYRQRHGVPALTWSDSVAASAQAYAEKCIFEHSGAKGLGENLATGYKDWTTAVKVWYDEESQYDYNDGQFSEATGHFTQLVWKNTKQLGCGYSTCKGVNQGRAMYVCQYSPAGNILGRQSFQSNVPRPVAA